MGIHADRYGHAITRFAANEAKTSTVGRNQREFWGGESNRLAGVATDEGEGDVVGDLSVEQGLKARLCEARRQGQPRPELAARLKVFRDRRK